MRRRTSGKPAREFSTHDVARTLGVSAKRIRVLVHAGVCKPSLRGHAWRFRFQDLVLLRTALGLVKAKVPVTRLHRALTALRRQLPQQPLTGVRVYADRKDVVVRTGKTLWQPGSGQVLFSFAVKDLERQANGLAARQRVTEIPASEKKEKRPQGEKNASAYFERGLHLEGRGDNPGAEAAYRRAIDLDPRMADAYVNLGRLAHTRGDIDFAAQLYHAAVDLVPHDPVGHYNLALTLEDRNKPSAAIRHYLRAIELDTDFADAHFNLARLLERSGHRSQALRHLAIYKRLTDA